MGDRARRLRPVLGTVFVVITVALTGCGAAALPPPPPPGTPTTVAAATKPPVAVPTKAATTAPAGGNTAQLAAGKAAFNSAGCGGCHMLTAAGSTGAIGPSLNGIGAKRDAAWIIAQIKDPCAAGHANAAGSKYSCQAMPANLASGATAQAIAAFLAAQK
jgi:cytochrome c551/c552